MVLAAALLIVDIWRTGPVGFPRAGDRAPSFTLENLNGSGAVGDPQDGGAGGKPVVILFMANWCSICQQEIPKLAATITDLHAHRGALRQLEVIGVDSGDPPGAAETFLHASHVTFPVGDDASSRVISSLYGFDGDPYAVFVRGDGTILAIHAGSLSPAQLISYGRRLLAT
jgi:peroxiredoxin